MNKTAARKPFVRITLRLLMLERLEREATLRLVAEIDAMWKQAVSGATDEDLLSIGLDPQRADVVRARSVK